MRPTLLRLSARRRRAEFAQHDRDAIVGRSYAKGNLSNARRSERPGTFQPNEGTLMTKTSIAAVLAAVAIVAAAPAADAACFTRPGTPNRMKAEPVNGHERDTIRLTWFDTVGASERVWHDIEVTDGTGRLVQSLTGVGIGAMLGSKQQSERDFGGLKPNTTRCFRMKARTEAGFKGCVSKNWSGRVCGTTTSAPNTKDTPGSGKWGALAADGKGRWGFAVNQPTQWAAQFQARKGCGDQACTVRISAQVACYAYFESRGARYAYGLALHSSGATALQVARRGCESNAPAGTCKLVKSNCGS
jgi:hypothetical protein